MQILLCQHAIEPLAPDRNHARVLELLRGTGIRPPALLILPELFSLGSLPPGFDPGRTDSIRAADLAFLAGLARSTGAHVLGTTLGHAGNKMANESVLLDPVGAVCGQYRKIHPFSPGGEGALFESGSGAVTWNLEGFVLQPALCYDLRFPEMFRAGLRRGMDLITVQANWPESRQAHWETLLRARAIENQCFVAGVNCLGLQRGTNYAGGSAIISPKGETLVSAGTEEGVFTATLDPETARSWRRAFPALVDRKPREFWN